MSAKDELIERLCHLSEEEVWDLDKIWNKMDNSHYNEDLIRKAKAFCEILFPESKS